MRLQAEETVNHGIKSLFGEQRNGQKFALGFAHLARVCVEVQNVNPIVAPLVTKICLGLCNLVGVVRECVIDTTAVNIKTLAKMLHADARALDVPSGVTDAPRAIPFELLVVELGLCKPKNKVCLVLFVAVGFNTVANTDCKVSFFKVVENVILLELGGIKVDVAACLVSKAFFEQGLDNLDKLINARGCGLYHLGTTNVERVAILKELFGVELRDFHNGLLFALCALEHLVLARVGITCQVTNVGDVHNAGNVVAAVTEVAVEDIFHNVGAQITDVRKVIHRRAAGVHAHLAGLVGNEFFFFSGCRVIKLHNLSPFAECFRVSVRYNV